MEIDINNLRRTYQKAQSCYLKAKETFYQTSDGYLYYPFILFSNNKLLPEFDSLPKNSLAWYDWYFHNSCKDTVLLVTNNTTFHFDSCADNRRIVRHCTDVRLQEVMKKLDDEVHGYFPEFEESYQTNIECAYFVSDDMKEIHRTFQYDNYRTNEHLREGGKVLDIDNQ